jgi:cytochrome c556
MFLSVRNGFDAVADQARANAPTATINRSLADTMRNCVACHQTYRIDVKAQ